MLLLKLNPRNAFPLLLSRHARILTKGPFVGSFCLIKVLKPCFLALVVRLRVA